MSRPEHLAPPEVFYNSTEARKYARASRINKVQRVMSERAVELLNIDEDRRAGKLILDIGCGSGLSGEILTEAGFQWVGMDISGDMLEVAVEREVDGDVLQQDMGQGTPFRQGVFDGAISISALQWLCNADKREHDPRNRLRRFFSTLYRVLVRSARVIFQFYPENRKQLEMITSTAMQCGFSGGLVVDYPHSTRAKKYYLCLFAGHPEAMPEARTHAADSQMDEGSDDNNDSSDGEKDEIDYEEDVESAVNPHRRGRQSSKFRARKNRQWILEKKSKQRLKGNSVRHDSKYTGRKRKARI